MICCLLALIFSLFCFKFRCDLRCREKRSSLAMQAQGIGILMAVAAMGLLYWHFAGGHH